MLLAAAPRSITHSVVRLPWCHESLYFINQSLSSDIGARIMHSSSSFASLREIKDYYVVCCNESPNSWFVVIGSSWRHPSMKLGHFTKLFTFCVDSGILIWFDCLDSQIHLLLHLQSMPSIWIDMLNMYSLCCVIYSSSFKMPCRCYTNALPPKVSPFLWTVCVSVLASSIFPIHTRIRDKASLFSSSVDNNREEV